MTKLHPDVLAVHAQFGGDLADMQRRYDAAKAAEQDASLRRVLGRQPHDELSDDPLYDVAKDGHDSYYAAIEAKRLRGDARRVLMRECPFCATPIRRVVSKARSFDPPRDYIEWHHDTPSGPCYLFAKLGPVISSTRDDPVAEQIFLNAWNTRS